MSAEVAVFKYTLQFGQIYLANSDKYIWHKPKGWSGDENCWEMRAEVQIYFAIWTNIFG